MLMGEMQETVELISLVRKYQKDLARSEERNILLHLGPQSSGVSWFLIQHIPPIPYALGFCETIALEED